jgi:site-specific recombinase XerD
MAIDTVERRSRLRPRAAPYWYKLASGRQLGFRKMTTASEGTWLAQAYDEDSKKQSRRSLGSFTDLPANKRFDAAVAAAREYFAHIDAGGDNRPLTVREACEEYVKHLSTERPKAAADTAARYRRWVYGDKLAKVSLAKMTERQVKEWRATLSRSHVVINPHAEVPDTKPRAPASVNRDMTALRAALNHARRLRAVTSDMAWRYALEPIKNADGRRETYLEREQRRALMAQAPVELAAFIRGLSLLPVRPGALACLTVASFDKRLGVLLVGRDKSGRDRKIKLPRETADFFAEQCRGKTPAAPLLARADGKPWNKDSWKKPLKAAAMTAGLGAAVTAYTLRHSVITDLVTGGLDLLTVAQLSGTSVLMIEKHYGHHRAEHAAAALAGLVV